MFEEEAEERIKEKHSFQSLITREQGKELWQDGAEFGYNKGKNEATEIIKLLLWDLRNRSYNPEKDMARAEELLGRNK